MRKSSTLAEHFHTLGGFSTSEVSSESESFVFFPPIALWLSSTSLTASLLRWKFTVVTIIFSVEASKEEDFFLARLRRSETNFKQRCIWIEIKRKSELHFHEWKCWEENTWLTLNFVATIQKHYFIIWLHSIRFKFVQIAQSSIFRSDAFCTAQSQSPSLCANNQLRK